MLNLKYPILQSGFLALSESGLIKQTPESPTFSDTILFRERNHEYDNLHYSEDVTKLFMEWHGNRRVMTDIAFQHRILEQAMKRFGTSILDWINFQSNKPGFSNTHKQFLIKLSSWTTDSYEQPSSDAEAVRWLSYMGPSQGNNIQLNVGELPGLPGMTSTVEAISNWLVKPAGYESLLVYLYVIFGKRTGATMSFDN